MPDSRVPLECLTLRTRQILTLYDCHGVQSVQPDSCCEYVFEGRRETKQPFEAVTASLYDISRDI